MVRKTNSTLRKAFSMRIKRLDFQKLPSPYREILQREVEKLKKQDGVLAIGLAGSAARGDFWHGADLDIEVIVEGDKPKRVLCTEQEISVDYGYFSESHVKDVPHDTLPIHDPTRVLTKVLEQRSKKQLWKKMIQKNIDSATKYIQKAKLALKSDLYSALCLVQVASDGLGSGLILASGMAPSARRTISKLEESMKKIGRLDLFDKYVSLYGMPATLETAEFLLRQLEQGYKEVWGYFKRKSVGPIYMLQQPDSESWFKNRIEPLFKYDKRDLVWLVFVEYHFVLRYIFKTIGKEDFPEEVFEELRGLTGPPALWVNRYRRILKLMPETDVPGLLATAEELHSELKNLASKKYLK